MTRLPILISARTAALAVLSELAPALLLRQQAVWAASRIGLLHGVVFMAGTMHWFFNRFGIFLLIHLLRLRRSSARLAGE